ncbi:pentatricopeptide repeat-containing protein At5g50990 isoform X2 [Carica papaya]|uniref:pentatricopeptide repeat-containing protein At5g50990 isoform X2 n=1 Tax=Carica papaya TaxID=3649 RepID=UPI000B8C7F2E|nr:pentatricopeptide repeat-containing protein At5g50990 isoform X2 [Carica papaya]
MHRNGAKRLAAQVSIGSTKAFSASPLSCSSHTYHDITGNCYFACLMSPLQDSRTSMKGFLIQELIIPWKLFQMVEPLVEFLNLAKPPQILKWQLKLMPELLDLVIESLMRIGECELAKKVFDKMPEQDTVTWNSIIGGHVRNLRFEEALRFFRKMLRSTVEPDKFTFASAIKACARLGTLNHALWVHGLMIEKTIEMNYILGAALIDMYSKCGRIQTAKEIFESIPHNDVSIWNAMINGLAIHGLAEDAIGVFSKMEMKNVLPDSITFLGILTACSHCGLVEEGRRYFKLMCVGYSIQPELEHYGAMVDLLGRAGKLEMAYAMIKEMPFEPDVVIWRALLSGCRTHKNPQLGEVAITNISRLSSGDYVLLSNIYSSLNNWDGAEHVRETMKKKKVRKNRGKSWFELDGVIYKFKAGDRSHVETEAI